MKTYIELKDQVAKPPQPSPAYPERPDMTSPKKAQTSKGDTSKETKKINKTQQTNKRQYKVRVVEKPIILTRLSAILIPTTAATTQPKMSSPTRTTTQWPLLFQSQQTYLLPGLGQYLLTRKAAQHWQSRKWWNQIFQNLKVPQQGK